MRKLVSLFKRRWFQVLLQFGLQYVNQKYGLGLNAAALVTPTVAYIAGKTFTDIYEEKELV